MHHISCPTQKLPCPVNHMCTSHTQKHHAQTRWSCTCLIKHRVTKVYAVVRFMPQLVYPWYVQNTQLRGPQSHSGHYREKKLFAPAENETPIPQSPSLWPSNYTVEPAASMYPWWQRPNILLQCWCSNNRLYLTSQNTSSSLSSSLWLKSSPTTNIWLAVTSSPWISEHHPNHLCNHLHYIKLQCKITRHIQLHCMSRIVNFSIYVFAFWSINREQYVENVTHCCIFRCYSCTLSTETNIISTSCIPLCWRINKSRTTIFKNTTSQK